MPIASITSGKFVFIHSIARSVLLSVFEEQAYLLCGLGDGHLVNFRLEPEGLTDMKTLALGTKPIALKTFR